MSLDQEIVMQNKIVTEVVVTNAIIAQRKGVILVEVEAEVVNRVSKKIVVHGMIESQTEKGENRRMFLNPNVEVAIEVAETDNFALS